MESEQAGSNRPRPRNVDALQPGSIVATRYRINRRISVGGQAEVYEASHLITRAKVAVKCALPATGSRSNLRNFQRMHQEAMIMADIRHPFIAQVHDAAVSNDRFVLVMEYVEGVTLRERIEHSTYSAWQACKWIRSIAKAMEFAHSRGVRHRDLKPENVVVTEADSIKVVDFGLAKSSFSSFVTEDGERNGTSGYMAPELFRAGSSDEVRADVFAIGMIFLELMLGRHPHATKDGAWTCDNIRDAMRAWTLRDLEPLLDGISPQIAQVLRRALHEDPAHRYTSATELGLDAQAAAFEIDEEFWESRPAPRQDIASSDKTLATGEAAIHRFVSEVKTQAPNLPDDESKNGRMEAFDTAPVAVTTRTTEPMSDETERALALASGGVQFTSEPLTFDTIPAVPPVPLLMTGLPSEPLTFDTVPSVPPVSLLVAAGLRSHSDGDPSKKVRSIGKTTELFRLPNIHALKRVDASDVILAPKKSAASKVKQVRRRERYLLKTLVATAVVVFGIPYFKRAENHVDSSFAETNSKPVMPVSAPPVAPASTLNTAAVLPLPDQETPDSLPSPPANRESSTVAAVPAKKKPRKTRSLSWDPLISDPFEASVSHASISVKSMGPAPLGPAHFSNSPNTSY